MWVYYMQPLAQDPSLSLPERLISLAYPLLDLLLLIVLVRLLLTRGARNGSMGWLVASTIMLLGADAWFTQLSTTSGYQAGDLVDGLWLLAYVCWGVAALHPSTARELTPFYDAAVKPSRVRIALLATAGLVLPALLWFRAAHGLDTEPALALGSLLVFGLTAIRMALLVREVETKAATLAVQGSALEAALARKHDLEEQLRRQAFNDDLTGLANRRFFGDRLQQALLRGERSLHSVALLFVDVDDSRPSTTPTVTAPEIEFCARWVRASRAACERATPWLVGAGTSSPCSSGMRTVPRRPSRRRSEFRLPWPHPLPATKETFGSEAPWGWCSKAPATPTPC